MIVQCLTVVHRTFRKSFLLIRFLKNILNCSVLIRNAIFLLKKKFTQQAIHEMLH